MTEYLTKEEADGMKLWDRECVLRARGCEPVQPQYMIAWEDPDDLDGQVKYTTPSPQWLGYVMHGNFTCDIEVHIQDRRVEAQWIADHPGESFSWKAAGGAKHPYAETIGAMTEEEAMEYCMMWSVPERVWGVKHNAVTYKIIKRDMVPSREFRNAQQLIQPDLQEIAA